MKIETSPPEKIRRAAAILLYEAGVTDLDKITPEQKASIAAGLYMVDPADPRFVMPTEGKKAQGPVRVTTGVAGGVVHPGTIVRLCKDQARFVVTKGGACDKNHGLVRVECVTAGSAGNTPEGMAMRFETPPPGCAMDLEADAGGLHGGEDPVRCRIPGDGFGRVAEALNCEKGLDWRGTPDAHAIGTMLGLRQPDRASWLDVGEYVYVSSLPNGMRGSNVRVDKITQAFAWIAGTVAVPIGYVIANYKPSTQAPFRIGLPCPGCGEPFGEDMITGAHRTEPCDKCQEKRRAATLDKLAAQIDPAHNKTGDLSTARQALRDLSTKAVPADDSKQDETIVPRAIHWSASDDDVPRVVAFAGHAFTAKRAWMRSGFGLSSLAAYMPDEGDRTRRPYEIAVDAVFTADTAKTLAALLQCFDGACTEGLIIAGLDADPAESIHILRASAIEWHVTGRALHVVFREERCEKKATDKQAEHDRWWIEQCGPLTEYLSRQPDAIAGEHPALAALRLLKKLEHGDEIGDGELSDRRLPAPPVDASDPEKLVLNNLVSLRVALTRIGLAQKDWIEHVLTSAETKLRESLRA